MNTFKDSVLRPYSTRRPRRTRHALAMTLASAVLGLAALPCAAGWPPATYNLGAIPGDVGATIEGPGLAAHAGSALAGGCDINGDGIPDIIIGAPPGGDTGQGVVYVIFGNAAGAPPPFHMTDADVTITGENEGDSLGTALACADVNGDGFDDIIMTAPAYTPAGMAYVIYGSASLPPSIDLTTLTIGQGMRVPGLVHNAGYGIAVAVGDVNGDGIADFAVTSPGTRASSDNTGQAFVVFGSTTFPASLDLNTLNGSNGFSITATDLYSDEPAGDSIAIGDLNGDGFGDVAMGSRQAFPNNADDGGTVYVIFGQSGGFPAEVDAASLNGSNGFAVEAAESGHFAGTSLAFLRDFNNDGIADLVVGAPGTASGPRFGTAYVVFGAHTFPAHFNLGTLDGSNGVSLVSATVGDGTGASVANALDLNGDYLDDVLIGAPQSNVGGSGAGGGYVVYSRRVPFPASIDLSTLNGATGFYMQGAAVADAAGTALAAAGRWNHDPMSDLLIAAPLADVNGTVNVGQVYMLYGNDLIFADGFDGAQ